MPRRDGPRCIVITGASSGLGAALAQLYAAPGVTLGLVARNAERLLDVAEACRKRGATVESAMFDVTQAAPLAAWLETFDRASPIDLLLANAGISGGTAPNGTPEGVGSATRQVSVNLIGVMNAVETLLPAMRRRRQGHIAMVSSVAGYRGLPYSPGYSASKAGVRAYGEGLRALLRPSGVAVSVISPGFFDSPMTDRFIGGRPFLLSGARAAAIVKRGLDRRKPRIVFPALLVLGMRFVDLAPAFLGDFILRRVHFHILPRSDA